MIEQALEVEHGGLAVTVEVAETRGLRDDVMQRENGEQQDDEERPQP